MRVSNKNCRTLVEAHEPFTASNLFAENVNGFYVVYSYGHHWPLWAFDGQTWYENVDKYSPSTTRHKSQSNPYISAFQCGTAQLKEIISGGVYRSLNREVAA